MRKKLNYILASSIFLVVLLSSCSITSTSVLNKKMEAVKPGMSQEEVVSILGKNYTNDRMTETPEGILSTIFYAEGSVVYYYFYFMDNRLVEWVREYDDNAARRISESQSRWHENVNRQRAFDEMKDLKKREVEALEKANKDKK